MTRIILSSLAVVALLATSATPAASQAKLDGQQPTVAPIFNALTNNENIGGISYKLFLSDGTPVNHAYMKSTWERHLSTGARNPPPPDCPRPDPKNCLESWD